MKFIEPSQLVLPRVYFTEFDRVTYTQYEMELNEVKEIYLNLERKIKLLSLIKGHIVIAASHLIESEIAQDFVFKNTILLTKGIILPALISEYRNFNGFLDAKTQAPSALDEKELYLDTRPSVSYGYRRPSDVARYLDEHTDSVVTWSVANTSDYFKRKLLEDFNNGNSLLRFNLDSVGAEQNDIDRIVKEIEAVESLSRKHVYAVSAKSPYKAVRALVPQYADFIYYLSGALAVNSEGVLPQENLMDFSFTDLVTRKTRLSEYEVFYRIFIGIIESKVQKYFPTYILDKLTFDEIIDIRKSLLGKSFVEKYNGLIALTKAGLHTSDPDCLILNLKELFQYEQELHEMFQKCVELEIYQQKAFRSALSGGKILINVGEIVSFYGVVESLFSLMVNLMSFLGLEDYKEKLARRLRSKLKDLSVFVDTSAHLKKPIFLEFLNQVAEEYKTKLI